MKRLIFILFLLASFAQAEEPIELARMSPAIGVMGGGATAAVQCSAATDYIGNTTIESAGSNALTADRVYLELYQPTCASGCTSGNSVTAYVRHAVAEADNLKFCAWLDDGDEAPDASDTQLGCVTLSSSSIEWDSGTLNASISCASKYWIGLISDASTWNNVYNTVGNTVYYLTIAGSYDSPPANLSGTWASVTRKYSMYLTIGP